MATPRVDFYVLASADPAARLRVACKLIEKAYLGEHRVRVQFDPGGDIAALDDLLWTFADQSFVPHERLGSGAGQAADIRAPVALADDDAADDADLLVNLAAGVPPAFQRFARIIEIVDADAERRRLGRERFRHYRAHGIEPGNRDVKE